LPSAPPSVLPSVRLMWQHPGPSRVLSPCFRPAVPGCSTRPSRQLGSPSTRSLAGWWTTIGASVAGLTSMGELEPSVCLAIPSTPRTGRSAGSSILRWYSISRKRHLLRGNHHHAPFIPPLVCVAAADCPACGRRRGGVPAVLEAEG